MASVCSELIKKVGLWKYAQEGDLHKFYESRINDFLQLKECSLTKESLKNIIELCVNQGDPNQIQRIFQQSNIKSQNEPVRVQGQTIQQQSQQLQQNNQVDLTIKLSSQRHLQQLQQWIGNNLSKIMKEFINHLNRCVLEGRLSEENKFIAVKQFIFKPNTPKSGGTNAEPLIADEFRYQMLPSFVHIEWNNVEIVFQDNIQLNAKIQSSHDQNRPHPDDELYFQRFLRFIKYFDGYKIISYISNQQIKLGIDCLRQNFYGLDEFAKEFSDKMEQFNSEVYESPKGVLLHGPPGTGKSAILSKFSKAAQFTLATLPMAAGDFSKGIVGDGEKMLVGLADRAKLVAWEMCVMIIDEIDSLAPSRDDPNNKSNANSSLFGKFLQIMDGSIPNLKIFSSTNLRDRMDEAFLRRLEIQLFVGNPSPQARELWIRKKALLCKDQPNYFQIEDFLNDQNAIKSFVDMTINFSSDALRKVLERFYMKIVNGHAYKEQIVVIMLDCLKFISKEMNIFLGKDIVVEIIQQSQMIVDHPLLSLAKSEPDFQTLDEKGTKGQPTRRYLIDLGVPTCESLQIDLKTPQPSLDTQRGLEFLRELQHDIIKIDSRSKLLDIYLGLIVNFHYIPHEDIGEGKDYNDIKNKFLKDQNLLQVMHHTCLSSVDDCQNIILHFAQSCEKFHSVQSRLIYQQVHYDHGQTERLWLPLILNFALKLNADCIKLIDENYFTQNYASDDNACNTLILNTINLMKQYRRSVIIFNLDSISRIFKNYNQFDADPQSASNAAMRQTFNYLKMRPTSMETALNIGKDLTISQNLWVFYVCKERIIVNELKQKLQLPESPSEMRFRKQEEEKDKERRCKNCLEFYTERENEREKKCGKHLKDTVYSDSEVKRIENQNRDFTRIQIMQMLRFSDSKPIKAMHAFEICYEKDIPFNEYKYTCCDGQLFSKGESPCAHEEMSEFLKRKFYALENQNLKFQELAH